MKQVGRLRRGRTAHHATTQLLARAVDTANVRRLIHGDGSFLAAYTADAGHLELTVGYRR